MNKENRKVLYYLRDSIIDFVGAKQTVKKEECAHKFDIYIKGVILKVMCTKCHKTIFYHELERN